MTKTVKKLPGLTKLSKGRKTVGTAQEESIVMALFCELGPTCGKGVLKEKKETS